MIHVTCTHCGKGLEVQSDRAGQVEPCPHCKQAVVIPNPFTETEQQVNIAHVIRALPGSPSNPFRGMDRQATLAALHGQTIKPYRLVGILGAGVLAAGTFLPIRGIPGQEQFLNCFHVGELGMILMMLAVMGLSLTLTRSNTGLLAVSLAALTVILVSFFQYATLVVPRVDGRTAGNVALEIRWGWSVLLAGALLLLGATVWGEKLPLRKQR
jgi:hypothetical protein